MDIREKIEQRPMGRTQVGVVAFCVLLNMFDGFDVLAVAFTSTALMEEWGLTASQLGLLLSAALLGMSIGSALVSQVADVVGRRATILTCCLVIALGMTAAALAPTFTVMLVARVVTGVAIGTLQPCLNVLVSEYSSARQRPTAVSWFTAGQPVGGVLGGTVAALLLSTQGWRAVFAFGAAASLVLLVAVWRLLPESVDYLVSRRPKGALERLNAILVRLRLDPVTALPAARPRASTAVRWQEVLRGRQGLVTVTLTLAFIMLMAGFYFANSWTPRLVVESGFAPADGTEAGVMFSVGGIVGSLVFGPVAGRLGTRRTLVSGFLLSGVAFAAYANAMGSLTTAFVVAALLGGLTSVAMAGMFALSPQLFPPAARATGMGIVIGVGRVGAFVAPAVAGALVDAGWVPAQLYYLFVVPMLLGAAAVVALRWIRPAPATETVAATSGTSDQPVADGDPTPERSAL